MLDTHAFLWWLDGDPPAARGGVQEDRRRIKHHSRKRRFAVGDYTKARLEAARRARCRCGGRESGIRGALISILHAERAGRLPGDHRDPFDRMLIAQAQLEDIPIVSNERVLDAYGVNRIW